MKRGNNYDTARAFVRELEMKAGNLESYNNNGVSALRSYSTCIAVNCGGTILMDCKYYSATTARHKFHTRRAAAAAGLAIFEVPYIFPDCDAKRERNLSYLRNNVMFWRGKLERARTDRNRAYYRAQLKRAEDDAEAYKVNFLSKEGTR